MPSLSERLINPDKKSGDGSPCVVEADPITKHFIDAKLLDNAIALHSSLERKGFAPRIIIDGFESKLPVRAYTIRWDLINTSGAEEVGRWYSKGVRFVCSKGGVSVEYTLGTSWAKVSEDKNYKEIRRKIKDDLKKDKRGQLRPKWNMSAEVMVMALFAESHAFPSVDHEYELEKMCEEK